MKCVAIAMLSVGAFAAQDTTPPVISLTLAGETVDKKLTASKNCPVFSTMAQCPDPECSAHDHHDGSIECTKTVKNVNNNNNAVNLITGKTTATRNIRSEWLYKYDAKDASGNEAETVSFTLVIRDEVKPTLDIELEDENYGLGQTLKRSDGSSFLNPYWESCNQGKVSTPGAGDPVFEAHADPCDWIIPTNTATADDNVDGPINNLIQSALKKGAVTDIADSDLVSHKDAVHKIDTQSTGAWALRWKVCDLAGIFGANYENNCVEDSLSITIADTTPPVLTINSDTTAANTYECGKDGTRGATASSTYVEHNAICQDLADSWVTSEYKDDAVDVQIVKNVNTEAEGEYKVTYSCQDKAKTAKQSKERTVFIKDTEPPVIKLTGDSIIENSAGAHVSNADFEHGVTGEWDGAGMHSKATCVDACYATTTITSSLHYGACPDMADAAAVSTHEGKKIGDGSLSNFPEYTAGDYSVKYVCTDGASLTATTCRTIRNVDHTKPVIQVLGSNEMTLEATHEGNYIDDGATCSDQVDGVISQNVEVSGDVVNLSKVGSYTITYNCKDSAGNAAPTLSRYVHVAQTSCPTCVITGKDELTHEASFPYTDQGAVCTDIIDGTVTAETVGSVNVGKTGKYVLTYRAKNSVGLWNDGLAADGESTGAGCRGTAINYFRTVTISDTLKPVIKLTYDGETDPIAWSGKGPNSAAADTSGGAPANPYTKGAHTGSGLEGYPYNTLMAEEQTSSVNGWVLGAIASAVTGLALLGYSQRKTTVATSVPV